MTTRRTQAPRRIRRRFLISFAVTLLLALLSRQPRTTPAMRGYAVAQRLGCFTCHGPNGSGGVANPGSLEGEVPPLGLGPALAYYVQSDDELREWILFGAPRRLRQTRGSERLRGVIHMPAYSGLLTEEELNVLLAYLRSLSNGGHSTTTDTAVGYGVALQLGCFGCHGPGGRGGMANPGSFKGYIPPWDGTDFKDVVRDDAELTQWILDGTIARFERNPLATAFLHTQVIRMPAYRQVISEAELQALITYIRSLRGEPRAPAALIPTRAAIPRASRAERGKWLYHHVGCAACHGPEGRGGVPNANYVGGTVPSLDDLAEKMELFEPQHIHFVVSAIEQGVSLDTVRDTAPVPHFSTVLARYHATWDTIQQGSAARKRDPHGPVPPILMPSWTQRLHADASPGSEADIDAIIAYLLTLQASDAP